MAKPKTGGRQKGTPNKRTLENFAVIGEGILPLEVLLQSMRKAWEDGNVTAACAYAKEAAPYCHSKLSSMDATLNGKMGLTVEIVRFSDAA